MKLLIYARDWAPSVGGVQTIVKTLADGLADWSGENSEEAIEVTLLTQTPAGGMNASELPYRVVRKPGVMDFRQFVPMASFYTNRRKLLVQAISWRGNTVSVSVATLSSGDSRV